MIEQVHWLLKVDTFCLRGFPKRYLGCYSLRIQCMQQALTTVQLQAVVKAILIFHLPGSNKKQIRNNNGILLPRRGIK